MSAVGKMLMKLCSFFTARTVVSGLIFTVIISVRAQREILQFTLQTAVRKALLMLTEIITGIMMPMHGIALLLPKMPQVMI